MPVVTEDVLVEEKFGDRLHRVRGSDEGIASLGAPR